jgi:hypothetical protein
MSIRTGVYTWSGSRLTGTVVATEGKIARMSLHDSQTLVKRVDTDDLNRDEIREILYRYFNQIQNVIWKDALQEHHLLRVMEQ